MKKKGIELIKFAASSLSGFLVDYVMYVILLWILGEGHLAMVNIGARIISASVNFTLNRIFVFEGDEKLWKSAVKYALLAIFIILINTAILFLLTEKTGINRYLAKIVVELILFMFNWLVQRTIVFQKNRRKK